MKTGPVMYRPVQQAAGGVLTGLRDESVRPGVSHLGPQCNVSPLLAITLRHCPAYYLKPNKYQHLNVITRARGLPLI